MAMNGEGGVGAGGSGGGDDPRARAGDVKGNGKAAVREVSWRVRENNRRRERSRREFARMIFDGLRKYGNYTLPRNCDNNVVLMALCEEAGWTVEADGTTYRKVQAPKPPASDQHMATATNGGGSAPVNNPDGASYSLTRPSSPSGVTLGSSSSGGAGPVPPLWATGAGASRFSFQSSTPPLMGTVTGGGRRAPSPDPVSLLAAFQMSNAAANKAPGYISFVASDATSLGAGSSTSASARMLSPLPGWSSSGASATVCGRGGMLISPLGFSFHRSGGEQAGVREEVITEKDADEEGLELTLGNVENRKEEGLELTLGNAETRKEEGLELTLGNTETCKEEGLELTLGNAETRKDRA